MDNSSHNTVSFFPKNHPSIALNKEPQNMSIHSIMKPTAWKKYTNTEVPRHMLPAKLKVTNP
jgi:hypothetical protein